MKSAKTAPKDPMEAALAVLENAAPGGNRSARAIRTIRRHHGDLRRLAEIVVESAEP